MICWNDGSGNMPSAGDIDRGIDRGKIRGNPNTQIL
jgi:hypothetical protein